MRWTEKDIPDLSGKLALVTGATSDLAIATWSLAGLVFVCWTLAKLLPRALSNRAWCQPSSRTIRKRVKP